MLMPMSFNSEVLFAKFQFKFLVEFYITSFLSKSDVLMFYFIKSVDKNI